MGFIPIVLALAGFILLWGMVNYSSFSTQRAAIQANTAEKIRLEDKRSDILKKLSALLTIYRLSLPDYLAHLVNQPHSPASHRQMTGAIEDLLDSADQHVELTNNEDFSGLVEALRENIIQLARLQSRQAALIRDYNRQTQSMPSRIVAVLFNFQAI